MEWRPTDTHTHTNQAHNHPNPEEEPTSLPTYLPTYLLGACSTHKTRQDKTRQDETRRDETRRDEMETRRNQQRTIPPVHPVRSVRPSVIGKPTHLSLHPTEETLKEKLRSSGEERRAHNPEVTRSKRVAANLECYIFVLFVFFYLAAHTSQSQQNYSTGRSLVKNLYAFYPTPTLSHH
jgi:hypothetical protein